MPPLRPSRPLSSFFLASSPNTNNKKSDYHAPNIISSLNAIATHWFYRRQDQDGEHASSTAATKTSITIGVVVGLLVGLFVLASAVFLWRYHHTLRLHRDRRQKRHIRPVPRRRRRRRTRRKGRGGSSKSSKGASSHSSSARQPARADAAAPAAGPPAE